MTKPGLTFSNVGALQKRTAVVSMEGDPPGAMRVDALSGDVVKPLAIWE